MELLHNLLNIFSIGEKEIKWEKNYELEEYDIIKTVLNVIPDIYSPIGDIVEVETLEGKYLERFNVGDIYVISSNFLAEVAFIDSSSVSFRIIDVYIQNQDAQQYNSYFENKFIYSFSNWIHKYSSLLSEDLLNLKNKEPFYESFLESIKYYNAKSLYNNFFSKFVISHYYNSASSRYEFKIYLDGTSIPDEFYQKISNFYLNIWVFSYDVVFFFEKVEGEIYNDNLYTYGYVKNWKTNLLEIPPHYSFYINNEKDSFTVNIVDNQINKYTEFEEQLGITDTKKLVIFFNFSMKDISNFKHVFENVWTLPFFVII